MTDELHGLSVLVTRPSHQADNLVRLIESHGGEALRFPTLQIEANADNDAIVQAIGDITSYDIAIFISMNAVSHGVRYLPAAGKRPLLSAIGPSTARALTEAGFPTDIKATRGFTSEALLREPAFKNVAGKKIVIFRGSGGRALLGRELEQRGATVTYAEVYRRDRPESLDPEIESRLSAGTVDLVTATSAETLVNLCELAEERSVTGLTRARLVTTSERVVKKAAALGFEQPALLASGPDDQALVEAILEWRRMASQTDSFTGTTMTEPSLHERNESTDDKENLPMDVVDEHSDADNATRSSGPARIASALGKSADKPADNSADQAAQEPASKTTDEVPSTAAPVAPAPIVVKRGGGFISLLAILLALAALALAGYLWWEQRQATSASAATQTAANTAIETTQQQIADLGGRLDENLARLSGLESNRGRLDSGIDDLRGSVEALTARVQGTEQSIDAVSGVSANARNSWVRAEAEYFLQIANSRLQLARDPKAALAALQAADDRLKSLGDPTLFRVRQALAGEIAALKAVPQPDLEGIAHTLNGLASQVDELPLNNASPGSYQVVADTGETGTQSPMDRALATVKNTFTGLISIKRTGEEATPLLSVDEAFFLKRNLELQIQIARLALLRGQPENYRESLRTARNWVQNHFRTDAAAVASTIATLAELERENISPPLPDISGSLSQLRLADATATAAPATAPVRNAPAVTRSAAPATAPVRTAPAATIPAAPDTADTLPGDTATETPANPPAEDDTAPAIDDVLNNNGTVIVDEEAA